MATSHTSPRGQWCHQHFPSSHPTRWCWLNAFPLPIPTAPASPPQKGKNQDTKRIRALFWGCSTTSSSCSITIVLVPWECDQKGKRTFLRPPCLGLQGAQGGCPSPLDPTDPWVCFLGGWGGLSAATRSVQQEELLIGAASPPLSTPLALCSTDTARRKPRGLAEGIELRFVAPSHGHAGRRRDGRG